MEKDKYTLYLTKETYKKFQILCILKNSNASNEVDKMIKEMVEKEKDELI